MGFYQGGYNSVGFNAHVNTPELPLIVLSPPGFGGGGGEDGNGGGRSNFQQGAGGQNGGGGGQEDDGWSWDSEPGLGESLIPVWGSGRSAAHHFSKFASDDGTWGDLGWGIGYTALAITDVFLVKAIAVGVGKLAVKGFAQAGLKGMFKNGFKALASPGWAKFYTTNYYIVTKHVIWKSAGKFFHGLNGVVKPIGQGRLLGYVDGAGAPILGGRAFPVWSTALQNRRGKWFYDCAWTAAARYIEGNALPLLAGSAALRGWFAGGDDDNGHPGGGHGGNGAPDDAGDVDGKVPADVAPEVGGTDAAGDNNSGVLEERSKEGSGGAGAGPAGMGPGNAGLTRETNELPNGLVQVIMRDAAGNIVSEEFFIKGIDGQLIPMPPSQPSPSDNRPPGTTHEDAWNDYRREYEEWKRRYGHLTDWDD